MPARIDWFYIRTACTTCKNARAYLDAGQIEVAEYHDARKEKIGPAEALKLLEGIEQLIAIKGKKVAKYDLVKARPADEELLSHLIGPTGNLRAPSARVGHTFVVGYNPDAYREVFDQR
jgi:arsenate reductase-like glutaredoxin family protein